MYLLFTNGCIDCRGWAVWLGDREGGEQTGKNREEGDGGIKERERERGRETSFKRVSGVPQGGQSDAISLSSPSFLHVETAFCHI